MHAHTMKALQFDRTGSLDALRFCDVPVPVAGHDEVLVKVHAAGINPSDIKNVLGRFPYTTVPRIPGRDFAGTVVAGPREWQGKDVWGSGKGVGFTRDGVHAEYVMLPVAALSLKPHTLSFMQAASCGVPYITALEALDRSGVQHGTRLLVIGGAGAVGSAAIALASLRGAQVVGAVRKPAQLDTLQTQGITSILLVDDASLADSVQQHFPGGADVILDTTGLWLAGAVGALRTRGTIAVISAPAERVVSFPLLDFYRSGGTVVGINSLLHELPACASMLDQLRTLFEEQGLHPPAHLHECALADGPRTYAAINDGDTRKTVFVL